jgi:hypothetical protein
MVVKVMVMSDWTMEVLMEMMRNIEVLRLTTMKMLITLE